MPCEDEWKSLCFYTSIIYCKFYPALKAEPTHILTADKSITKDG
jgi:hypothetical protein